MEIVRNGLAAATVARQADIVETPARPAPTPRAAAELPQPPATPSAANALSPGLIVQTALEILRLKGYQPPPRIAEFPPPADIRGLARYDRYLAQAIVWVEAARAAARAEVGLGPTPAQAEPAQPPR